MNAKADIHLAFENTCAKTLSAQFSRALAEADDSMCHGLRARGQYYVRRAFGLSVALIKHDPDTSNAIERLLVSSRYCFDLCPMPEETDQFFPIETIGQKLKQIVLESSHPNWLRAEALIAFGEVAPYAENLVMYKNSLRAREALCLFRELWDEYWPQLMNNRVQ